MPTWLPWAAIEGYEVTFNTGGVGQVSSIVHLFDTPGSATSWLTSQGQDFQKLVGTDVGDEFILKSFDELAAPYVGRDTFAGRFIITRPGLPLEIDAYFVSLRVGNLTARVRVVGIVGEDCSPIAEALARTMDQRIAGVAAGDITVAPAATPTATLVPTPTAMPQLATLEFRATDIPAPEGVSKISVYHQQR